MGLIKQQLLPCSKALRVQHDRSQTIQGQPFEKGHLQPCRVGRLAFHCGRKLAVIPTKNQLLAAMANRNQCCRLSRLRRFVNQYLMIAGKKKKTLPRAVFSKTGNDSLGTFSLRNCLQILFDFLLRFDQATNGKQVSLRMLLPALIAVQQTT